MFPPGMQQGQPQPNPQQAGMPNAQQQPQPGATAGMPNAQVDQMAQMVAMQQIEQAKQQYSQVAQAVVSLGDAFPQQKEKMEQLAAAVMQLFSDTVATLQQSPISPGV